MDPERTQAVFQQWLVRAASGADILDTVEESLAPDCLVHSQNGEVGGPEIVALQTETSRVAFPDLSLELEQIHFYEDKVFVQLILSGTHSGWLGPWPPTHRWMRSTAALVMRLNDDGAIAELWPYIALGAPLMFPAQDAE